MTDFIESARGRIYDAVANDCSLRIRGGGTKDFFGGALIGDVLDTREHSGVIAYDPSELVLTVKAGTPLAEVESTLAASNQCLPFEPPHFGEGATIGGSVASGLSGPRRPYAGSVRDYLLGAKLLDGRGELLSFGGQVMKNVAGFDLFRPHAGALGTLGLLLELSFKVLPKPEAAVTRVFESDAASAIVLMNRYAGQPLPLSGAAWHDGQLHLRLSGNAAAVRAATARLGGEDDPNGAGWWADLREHRLPFFLDDSVPLWRFAVKSTTPPLNLGDKLIDWGGGLRWVRSECSIDSLRAVARAAGGHVTAFRNGPRSAAFQPLSPALMALQRKLKQAFDPQGVFNRGRLYPDF
jgi:glycolate oxidase FAD binding subunit